MAYAAVFPEPVRARAKMSFPLSARGIAAFCIGNASIQPSLAIACSTYTIQKAHKNKGMCGT